LLPKTPKPHKELIINKIKIKACAGSLAIYRSLSLQVSYAQGPGSALLS